MERSIRKLGWLLVLACAGVVNASPPSKPPMRRAESRPVETKETNKLAASQAPANGAAGSEATLGMRSDMSEQTLRKFFEAQIPRLTKKHHLAGATFSVVYRGKILLQQGIGEADRESKRKVDPNKTLFRVGSISKLFTWIAVMQLVEAGKLDLHTDIQRYLPKLKLPATFGKPITIAHLMSHTPGFEDILLGLFTKDPKALKPLEQAVLERIPLRVRPPGESVAYSNYGTTLAGYLVEQVSGVPFEKYVQQKIFDPLGMTDATFSQIDTAKSAAMAKGYTFLGKDAKHQQPTWKPQGFEYISQSPAGAMSASAHAMARFMLGYLQGGALEGKRILREETIRRMDQAHFRPHPKARSFAHGWIEINRQNPRIIGHLGDTIYFHSACFLVPSEQLGVFFSTNTSTGMMASFSLATAFLKRFARSIEGRALAARRPVPSKEYLSQFAGVFATNRRSESDMTKLAGLGMRVEARVSETVGQLEIFDFLQGKQIKHIEVEPDVFQEVEGLGRWIFLRNKQKQVVGLFGNGFPVMTFVRPPWYESTLLNVGIVVLFLLCLLMGLFARPTGIWGWLMAKSRLQGEERTAGLFGLGVLVGYILFFLSILATISDDFIFEIPRRWVFWLPYLPMLLTIGMLYYAVLVWRWSLFGWIGRGFYTLFAVSASAFGWFLMYWKIVA